MKKHIFVAFIFLSSFLNGQAQINLVGAGLNSITGSIDIVTIQNQKITETKKLVIH